LSAELRAPPKVVQKAMPQVEDVVKQNDNALVIPEPVVEEPRGIGLDQWQREREQQFRRTRTAQEERLTRTLGEFRAKIAALEGQVEALKVAKIRPQMPIASEWTPATVFRTGEIVTHEGSTFQAKQDTGEPPSNLAHWTCLAAAGRNGEAGVQGPPGEQ